MKKNILLFIISTIVSIHLFSLIEKNDYNDIGLNEKNGTYDLNKYLRKSYLIFFTGLGTGKYLELGSKLNMFLEFPKLQGLYFNWNIYISRYNLSKLSWNNNYWWNKFIPYFGETYLGYKNKFISLKLGFQNFVSSDAIYNHLMIDDYSGSLLGFKINSLLSRYVDIELIYSIVRPHQGDWYQGNSIISNESNNKDKALINVYYGKSLYTHKINFRPLPWIRFGVFEGVYFLGENLNPWYANPFFIYIATQMISNNIEKKNGSRFNTHAANLMAGIDFNIGFNGWRIYGELLIDDFSSMDILYKNEAHPSKLAFIFGGEIRGYIFTKYVYFDRLTEYILKNFYINIEYGIVSKYFYARDSNFNYEYVRDEYKHRYYSDVEISDKKISKVNRIGNFLGFMYGPNSDCIDIAIGWRSDLYNVQEYKAGYQTDIYFDSYKKKNIPDRLFKMQIHFRNYRLGDERNVIMPYFWNENPSYDMETGEPKDEKDFGTKRKTEFLKQVLEIGDIFDINIYGDIVKFNRFVLGLETKFIFHFSTYYPFTSSQKTIFREFRWEFGVISSW